MGAGRELKTLSGHADMVFADGERVFTGSADDTRGLGSGHRPRAEDTRRQRGYGDVCEVLVDGERVVIGIAENTAKI